LRTGDSNRVEAQAERGLLYITEEDGLTHFCWTSTDTSSPLDDLIIFPGDATFSAVPQSPRSYVLKFASSSARHFYWCQDVDSSEDAARAARINELIQAQEEGPADEDVAMTSS
jgi:26S proteasome regulatory subunit N13